MYGAEREVQRVQWLTVNRDFCPMWSQCNCTKDTNTQADLAPGHSHKHCNQKTERCYCLPKCPVQTVLHCSEMGWFLAKRAFQHKKCDHCTLNAFCRVSGKGSQELGGDGRWTEKNPCGSAGPQKCHNTEKFVTACAGAANRIVSSPTHDGPPSPPGHSILVLLHRARDTVRGNDRNKTKKIPYQLLPLAKLDLGKN